MTIKAPTGGFVAGNLTSLVGGASFSETSRYDHPTEAPNFDYLSFTLQNLGTSTLSYQNGVEVPLFTFQNTGSWQRGNDIYLIDENDPFLPPNALNANVGQQLTTLGYGSNDVPICVFGTGAAACSMPLPGCLINLNLEGRRRLQISGFDGAGHDMELAR